MITEEEMAAILESPEARATAQQMMSVGVDPMAGFSFTRELMAMVNQVKFGLEQKYGIQVVAEMHVTIMGTRGQQEAIGGG